MASDNRDGRRSGSRSSFNVADGSWPTLAKTDFGQKPTLAKTDFNLLCVVLCVWCVWCCVVLCVVTVSWSGVSRVGVGFKVLGLVMFGAPRPPFLGPPFPGPPFPDRPSQDRPKFRSFFFFPLPPQNSFFSSLSEGLIVEFWWCFRRPGTSNVYVWSSRAVEAPAPPNRRGFTQQPESPNLHI